jgi:hypothetical protein
MTFDCTGHDNFTEDPLTTLKFREARTIGVSVDGESLNTKSLRRFNRFLSKTEHVDTSKFEQKISEVEGIAETNIKLPSN